MCIGLPMQVEALEPGHAWAVGRGERRRVQLALVGEAQVGEWLLVFLDGAREKLSPERAREVGSALDLLEAALAGDAERAQHTAFDFALPSALDTAELLALTGARTPKESP